MSKWIFLTGGSGYIGSHVAAQIKTLTDYSIMLIDRRSNMLPHTTKYCDVFADEDFSSHVVIQAMRDYQPEMVIHLAADSTIGPGIMAPFDTWDNNVIKTLQMLRACSVHGIKKVVFASSSSVYADSDNAVSESSPCAPCNPYARTKFAIEHALQDCYTAFGISSMSLRFFNVAGAHNRYDLGELHGSSHLLARIMESAVHGTPLQVFGRDWPTPDGTAIRDYIHVMDVVDAIMRSIKWLENNQGARMVNLGSGNGVSVQSMIDTTEMLLNKELPYLYAPRRPGDSAKRFSDNGLAYELLGWKPSMSLSDMIRDSYKWYSCDTYKNLTNLGIHHE
jgi:UDP-glucose 4-epimerase